MKALFSTLRFLILYAWEVVRGGFRIAWDLYTPGLPTSPRLVDFEVPPLDPFRRLLLANLVSMTPGSLSVDYYDDDRLLRVHLLYADTDSDAMKAAIRDQFLPAVQSLPFLSKP
jgi:multisubunit Na+/H+ antiporter MnhE subunit